MPIYAGNFVIRSKSVKVAQASHVHLASVLNLGEIECADYVKVVGIGISDCDILHTET